MVGRRWLEGARPLVEKLVAPLGALVETLRAVRVRMQILTVRQRVEVNRRFPSHASTREPRRVVAVITHFAGRGADGVGRVAQTIDGLMESLGHTRLTVILNTMAGHHAADLLPDYQRPLVEVREQEGLDPMFLGFEAQGAFADNAGADWFMYLEDDLVLADSLFLDKLDFFNCHAPEGSLLLPHRYEWWHGRKVYIDLHGRGVLEPRLSTNRLTEVTIGDWRFAEFENPHSGCFCLSQAQLQRWLASGRSWYGLSSFVGPRESAATGCLEECFRLYKPHPDNMTFLEVRHLGSKYAERYLATGR